MLLKKKKEVIFLLVDSIPFKKLKAINMKYLHSICKKCLSMLRFLFLSWIFIEASLNCDIACAGVFCLYYCIS